MIDTFIYMKYIFILLDSYLVIYSLYYIQDSDLSTVIFLYHGFIDYVCIIYYWLGILSDLYISVHTHLISVMHTLMNNWLLPFMYDIPFLFLIFIFQFHDYIILYFLW